MPKFYMNQRVQTIRSIKAPDGINNIGVGSLGWVKEMPRAGMLKLEVQGIGFCWVFADEIEPYTEQVKLPLDCERRVNIDPVVRVMFDALKAVSNKPGGYPENKQINAAIGQAVKHFKWLQAVTLTEKEAMVAETFPGIWRETRAVFSIYNAEEWAAMIDVLYIKAVQSRGGPSTRIVSGGINPIEAKNLKNLG